MKASLKALVTALAVAATALAILAPIASAGGSTAGAATNGMMGAGTGSWCAGGIWNGSGQWGGTGMWGTGSGMQWLTDNPVALETWLQLRADHQQAMQTWYDTFKADLTTPAAQKALHDLWAANWNDMKSFYEQYAAGAAWTSPSSEMWGGWHMGSMMGDGSWNANHMWGAGYGASWMTSHPAGFGQWLTMRGRQMNAVSAWWRQNDSAPSSPAARTALKTLSAHDRTQVKHFYLTHHLSASTSRMRFGAAGWMGLGGMWGGFGW